MKKLLMGALLLTSSLALASTYEIDPDHARANFSVKHLQITNVTGEMGKVTGTIELNDKDVTKSKVNATVDVTAISTGQEKRDKHLRSPDFFDVAKYPTLTFTSTKVEKAGDDLKVTGNLTMHGVTKPVTLDVEMSKEIIHPFTKKPTRAFTATTKIKREDFGLTWQVPGNSIVVGSEVKISLEVEAQRQGTEKKM